MKIYKSLFLCLVGMILGNSQVNAGERGTWVVRFDIDTPKKVKEICSKENQDQFDRFLVQVRGRADSWYESSFVPKAEGLPDFDPLASILEACTDVEVHAWINVYYLWTGDIPPVDLAHPYYKYEWILKDRTGRSVKDYSELEQRQHWIEGVYADPASLGYRAYFTKVVREIVENYNVAGVHLDFVRYPGSFFGNGEKTALSKLTRQDFAAYHNGSGDAEVRADLAERIAWDEQRASNVTQLVRDVKKTMDQVKPELRLSASVFPDVIEAFLDKGQKWVAWLEEELLDDVYVMAYFGAPARVQSQLSQCKQITDRYKAMMWAGLGAYIKSAEDIRVEIGRANKAGVDDICLFSLGHLLKQKKKVDGYQLPQDVEVQTKFATNAISPLVFSVLTDEFNYVDQGAHANNGGENRSIRLRGIFRYVDAHDDYAKVRDQYEVMQEVQRGLLEGKSFVQLSRKHSQAGTKRHAGLVPDLHYADARTPALQSLFDLQLGEYSDVLPVYNGFWIFQVLGES